MIDAPYRKKKPMLARNPMIPRTRPTMASGPPPSAPPLVAMRWREMKPMIAATGPRMTPKQMKLQIRERIPTIRAAIASPSVRGEA
jgi:hypothetical protein